MFNIINGVDIEEIAWLVERDDLRTARDKVHAIEERINKVPPEHHIGIPCKHWYPWPGVAIKEVRIPKTSLVTGAIHKYECLSLMTEGDILVLLDSGWGRLKGYNVVISPPGLKRIAFTLEDTNWVTLHHTKETDPAAIRRQFNAETEEEYQQFLNLSRAKAVSHDRH